jgi:hypothetical protein
MKTVSDLVELLGTPMEMLLYIDVGGAKARVGESGRQRAPKAATTS